MASTTVTLVTSFLGLAMFAIIINILVHYWNKMVESETEPGLPVPVNHTPSIPLIPLRFNPNTRDAEVINLHPPIDHAIRRPTPPPGSSEWETALGDIGLAH